MRDVYIVEQIKQLLNNYDVLNLKELDELRILMNGLSSNLGCYLYNKRKTGYLVEDRGDE